MPLHVAAHAVPSPGRPQPPLGTPPIGTQLPPLATSHAPHGPSHALLQQTPETQKPEAHDVFVVQAAPFAFLGTQWPASQNEVPAQLASVAQVVGQVADVPSHSVPPHVRVPWTGPAGTVVHVPTEPVTSQA